jgi:hypothetical protein
MRKRVSLVLIALAVVLGTAGSGAFSSAETDRSVSVAVVDDDEAYVGYDPVTVNATDGDTVALVTVTNRFQAPLDVTEVSITEPLDGNLSVDVTAPAQPTEIGVGGTGDVVATVGCEGPVDGAEIGVTVSVSGTGVAATLLGEREHRTVTVSCYP